MTETAPSSDISAAQTQGDFVPLAQEQRIHALDIVRGFALLGIFLMNVEWFTRPIADLGRGIDPSLHGLDYAVSWLVYVFVQGKFWTLFSLLFGMGFAVMLGRAERAERGFAVPYLRRIVALFLFGSLHFVLVWTGDILHNYAVAALGLLLIVTRSWKAWLVILLSLAATGLALRSPAVGAGLFFLALVGIFMFFLNRGTLSRYWKFGVAVYSLPFAAMLVGSMVMAVMPQQANKQTTEQVQKREEAVKKSQARRAEEIRIDSRGTYAEAVVDRAKKYAEDLPGAAGLASAALAMFLIGFWYVRNGIIDNLHQHLGLFKRLAAWTLPLGLAMTLLSVGLHAPVFTPGQRPEPSALASNGLFMWAALPLSIGYFSAMVCLIHTGIGSKLLSPLRHAGQMALSNYIGASVIGTLFFFGYGLGYWGQVSRPGQMAFVLVVFALQLLFSKWWLSKFRYGPLEWLWRAATYWQWPPLRRNAIR